MAVSIDNYIIPVDDQDYFCEINHRIHEDNYEDVVAFIQHGLFRAFRISDGEILIEP